MNQVSLRERLDLACGYLLNTPGMHHGVIETVQEAIERLDRLEAILEELDYRPDE